MNDIKHSKHIIDPDKLSQLWDTPLEHPFVDMDEVDEDKYIFTLKGGQLLSFSDNEPTQILLTINPAERENKGIITFDKITRVFYSTQRLSLILESKDSTTFSQIMIRSVGKFDIACGMSINLYESSSWSNLLERNLKIENV